jgi:phosphate acyltransferase
VFTASDEARAALDVVLPGLLDLRGRLDPESAGGAQLLGVRGVCIIGHGSSGAAAVQAGISVAVETVEAGLVDRVTERLRAEAREGGTQ